MAKRPPEKLNRRDFLKITALMAGGLAAAGLSARGGLLAQLAASQAVTVREQRYLMGTVIHLAVVAPDRAAGLEAVQAAFERMESLIGLFDPRRTGGTLAELNRLGRLDNPPPEFVLLLQQALSYGKLTGGAFDVTVKPVVDAYRRGQTDVTAELQRVDYRQVRVEANGISFGLPGMEVTLDGIAKGRVVDGGVAALQAAGCEQVVVEAGGDLFARGLGDGGPWRVAVAHPRGGSGRDWLAVFEVRDRAVATSGDYLNAFTTDYSRHHIIDPRRGVPTAGLCSATVIAPDTTQADALGTALMVMGAAEGLDWVEGQPDVECLLVTKSLAVHRSSGFPPG